MKAPKKAKATELVTRAARKAITRKTNSRTRRRAKQQALRSADHWFLDAAVYTRDGALELARAAAVSGLAALGAA